MGDDFSGRLHRLARDAIHAMQLDTQAQVVSLLSRLLEAEKERQRERDEALMLLAHLSVCGSLPSQYAQDATRVRQLEGAEGAQAARAMAAYTAAVRKGSAAEITDALRRAEQLLRRVQHLTAPAQVGADAPLQRCAFRLLCTTPFKMVVHKPPVTEEDALMFLARAKATALQLIQSLARAGADRADAADRCMRELLAEDEEERQARPGPARSRDTKKKKKSKGARHRRQHAAHACQAPSGGDEAEAEADAEADADEEECLVCLASGPRSSMAVLRPCDHACVCRGCIEPYWAKFKDCPRCQRRATHHEQPDL